MAACAISVARAIPGPVRR